MERSATSPEAMIASLPNGVREDVAALDLLIASVFAGRERVLWEGVFWSGSEQRIIGYGAYHSTNRSGKPVDWFVVGLAAQKDHLSLYVNAVRDGAYLVKAYEGRLGKAKVGSANVTFRTSAGLDLAVVRQLVEEARDLVPGR
jgi:hypothetical protein